MTENQELIRERLALINEKIVMIKLLRPVLEKPSWKDTKAWIKEVKKLITEVEKLLDRNEKLEKIIGKWRTSVDLPFTEEEQQIVLEIKTKAIAAYEKSGEKFYGDREKW